MDDVGVLVGGPGTDFVAQTLAKNPPQRAIREIQARASLRHPDAAPLLSLLDLLGCKRMEAHQHVLESSLRLTLDAIPHLSAETLLDLLESSFPFIGIQELRSVPIAVLGALHPVPDEYLQQLADDKGIFKELPPSVQRQIWEVDRALLQVHALPYLVQYSGETATAIRALDADEGTPPAVYKESATRAALAAAASALAAGGPTDGGPPSYILGAGAQGPGGRGGGAGTAGADSLLGDRAGAAAGGGGGVGGARPVPALPRRVLRNGSAALRRLVDMVGTSWKVYRGLVELLHNRFKDSESPFVGLREASHCTLRAQLLLALHDQGRAELCVKDPCYPLAQILDRCLRERTISSEQLLSLGAALGALEAKAAAAMGAAAPGPRGTEANTRAPSVTATPRIGPMMPPPLAGPPTLRLLERAALELDGSRPAAAATATQAPAAGAGAGPGANQGDGTPGGFGAKTVLKLRLGPGLKRIREEGRDGGEEGPASKTPVRGQLTPDALRPSDPPNDITRNLAMLPPPLALGPSLAPPGGLGAAGGHPAGLGLREGRGAGPGPSPAALFVDPSAARGASPMDPAAAAAAAGAAGAAGGPRPSPAPWDTFDVPSTSSKKARPLADAGLFFRDPSAQHLLAHGVLRGLEACGAAARPPGEDPGLMTLTRALQLSIECRAMLREQRYHVPQIPQQLTGRFYPAVARVLLHAAHQLQQLQGGAGAGARTRAASPVAAATPLPPVGLAPGGGGGAAAPAATPASAKAAAPGEPTQEATVAAHQTPVVARTGGGGHAEAPGGPMAQAAPTSAAATAGITPAIVSPSPAEGLSSVQSVQETLTDLQEGFLRLDTARRVGWVLILERLAAGDLQSARLVLQAASYAAERLSPSSMVEWAPFAVTLARRLAALVDSGAGGAGGAVDGRHPVWRLAVEGVLIHVIDAEPQVHEEYLRLILATSASLSSPQIAVYLQNALERTKRSRKRHRRRFEEEMLLELGPEGLLQSSAQAGYSSGGGLTSGFRPTALALLGTASDSGGDDGSSPGGALLRARFKQGDDGIRNTYKMVRDRLHPRLSAEIAPALFAYLQGQGPMGE